MKCRENLRDTIFDKNLDLIHRHTDRLFFWLLIAQWLFAIVLSLVVSPYGWAGKVKTVHIHVLVAVVLGGIINALPLVLIRARPGWWLTRQIIAVVQMLWSALLIHLTGGRIETHFHVFGSLAFLAFYRDWRLLPTATVIVAADHLIRGIFWPESVYGIANPEWWRFLEHAAWVAFENIILILGCFRAIAEMRIIADREAALEITNVDIDRKVQLRTVELTVANESLATEMRARLQMEAELRQAQKLESVGRLASGVAHEINTPIQFISDSVHFVHDAVSDLLSVIDKLKVVNRSVLDDVPSKAAAADALNAEQSADLPYLSEHVPKALDRALDGLDRVTNIVRSMKEFAHPDRKEMTSINLNKAITSTLTIARNEYKYVADVDTDFGELPPVTCHPSDVNQVVLNLVVNAAHAIGDVVRGTEKKGRITIRTRQEGDHVVVEVSDSGTGIPNEVRDKIFDPFFTTKETGKGTGQGLSIARSVVVEKHGGELTFDSEVGKGTTFHMRLPLSGSSGAPTGRG